MHVKYLLNAACNYNAHFFLLSSPIKGSDYLSVVFHLYDSDDSDEEEEKRKMSDLQRQKIRFNPVLLGTLHLFYKLFRVV